MGTWCLNKLIEREKDVTGLRRAVISWPKGRSMAERARSTRAWWKSKPWLHLHTNIVQSAILFFFLLTWVALKSYPWGSHTRLFGQKPLNCLPNSTHKGDNYTSDIWSWSSTGEFNSPWRDKCLRSTFDPLTPSSCGSYVQLRSSCMLHVGLLYTYHECTQDLLVEYLVSTLNWRYYM